MAAWDWTSRWSYHRSEDGHVGGAMLTPDAGARLMSCTCTCAPEMMSEPEAQSGGSSSSFTGGSSMIAGQPIVVGVEGFSKSASSLAS